MAGFIVCVMVVAIVWAIFIRNGLSEERKMAELEAELAEAKGKIAALETHSATTQQMLPLKGAE
jgi:hypothetical protein